MPYSHSRFKSSNPLPKHLQIIVCTKYTSSDRILLERGEAAAGGSAAFISTSSPMLPIFPSLPLQKISESPRPASEGCAQTEFDYHDICFMWKSIEAREGRERWKVGFGRKGSRSPPVTWMDDSRSSITVCHPSATLWYGMGAFYSRGAYSRSGPITNLYGTGISIQVGTEFQSGYEQHTKL